MTSCWQDFQGKIKMYPRCLNMYKRGESVTYQTTQKSPPFLRSLSDSNSLGKLEYILQRQHHSGSEGWKDQEMYTQKERNEQKLMGRRHYEQTETLIQKLMIAIQSQW